MVGKPNINAAEENIAYTIKIAREKFTYLVAGDKASLSKWFVTAKAASDEIRKILKDDKKDLSALDPEGKKTAIEMEKELVAATVKLQVSDVRKSFEKLKAGDIFVSPTYMADHIREDLKAVDQNLSALDPEGKKSADEMEKELTRITSEQQLKISNWFVTSLREGDIVESVAYMEKRIRDGLKEVGKKISDLKIDGKPITEEDFKIILATQQDIEQEKEKKWDKAEKLFAQLEKSDEKVPYSKPEEIEKYIRLLADDIGKELYALSGGEQTNIQVSERLRIAVEQERARSALAAKVIKDAKNNGETIVAYVKDREVIPVLINRR